ncbi:hypothetical protein DFH09DRAFT_1437861 [Mycena vulgaris]|nr:hypothetical protein DFH09DRAFT_1437861 [Mycena vulgaris]
MADMNTSDNEDGALLRTLNMPPPNASVLELREALKNTQLEMGRLAVENRELRVKLSALGERKGKKQRSEAANPHGYLAVVKDLGKKFGFIEEPWITQAAFASRPPDRPPTHGTPTQIDVMFKSSKSYLQYLTSCLYDHVPVKYHELIDSSAFPDFVDNLPFSSTPPVFYRGLRKNTETMLLNPVLPMAMRCMLFGAASLRDKGMAKPLSNTLGYIWQLDGLTISSICVTLIIIMRILSGVDANFEEKGKISGIPYLTYFHQYKKMLMKNAATPGVRNILRFWTKIVFQSASTSIAMDDEVVDDGEAEAAAEAEFAAAMEGMTLGDDSEEFGHDGGTRAESVEPPQVNIQPQSDAQVPDTADLDQITEDEIPIAPTRGRGKGRGGKGRGTRVRGRGRQVIIDSDDLAEPEQVVAVPRHRGHRAGAGTE